MREAAMAVLQRQVDDANPEAALVQVEAAQRFASSTPS